MGGGARRSAAAAPVRVLRQRARHPRPERRLRFAAWPAASGRPARAAAQGSGGDPVAGQAWTAVCRYDDLQPERGVAALVDGEQVALFRAFDGTLYAIGNQDPFTGAFVLSRGIVGTRGGIPTVASRCTSRSSTSAPGCAWTTIRPLRGSSASGCVTAWSRWRPGERRGRAAGRVHGRHHR